MMIMRHVLWFAASMAISLTLIFLIHHIHKHFVKTLTSPVEKTIANDAINNYKHIYADISNAKSKQQGAKSGANLIPPTTNHVACDESSNGCTPITLEYPKEAAETTPAALDTSHKDILNNMKDELREFIETNHRLNEPIRQIEQESSPPI